MKFVVLVFGLLTIFSCKQKDNNHIDVVDTQMAELKKERPFVFKDSIKCLQFWNAFHKALSQNDTNRIIKMSLKNVYCPVYHNDFNYYGDSKLVPLWFFLDAPYKENYKKIFTSLLQNAKPTVYRNNYMDSEEASDLGFSKENTIAGFSVWLETKEIANNYQLRKTHQFNFIESNGSFKFFGLEVGENGSRYLYELIPLDSLYFPISDLDTSTNQWYSKYLLQFKEPILYKNSTSDEVYRFTWLRSFHNPVVVRFEKHNDNYIIYTKEMLDYEGYIPQKIKVNTTQQITEYVWNNFKKKLNDIDFWNLQSKDPGPEVMDGALWVIEGLQKNKYHFTDRHSPEDKKYKDCCKYLLTLSNLNIPEKDIY